MPRLPALLLPCLLAALPAAAQQHANAGAAPPRGRAAAPPPAPRCLGPGALEPHRVWITPDAGGFAYRVMVTNNGPRARRFTVALGFANLALPPGAGQPVILAPRQSLLVTLGRHDRRATEEQVLANLRVTCLPG